MSSIQFFKFFWQKHRFPKQQCNITKPFLTKHSSPLTAFSKGRCPKDSSLTRAKARSEHGAQGYGGSLQHHQSFICNKVSLALHFCEVQKINHISWVSVEFFLFCPFVYYIFNTYYPCCLVTLKSSCAV